jgi:rhodanese-related sulfurtransferase
MAPLVPDIISAEFDFVIAFLMGLGFGYTLEQAGFSSTRKLVGLFYGYDFTVLKVFFTAGVTAMTGVLVLSHLGMLDMALVFVNPMFTRAAIVGGLIMGAGFIMGGFCPGTSLAGVAVGRLDAMVFVLGSFLGIFAFMEGFPFLKELYMADFLGSPTVPDVLGISPELFGLALTFVAVSAFLATGNIEDLVSGIKQPVPAARKKWYALASVLPVLAIALVWITPSAEEGLLSEASKKAQSSEQPFKTMDADKLAFELMHNAHLYHIVDIRDTSAFKTSIPTAINVPLNLMHTREWHALYQQPYKTIVIVGDAPENVYKAAWISVLLGDKLPMVLDVPVQTFRDRFFQPVLQPPADAPKWESDWYRFQQEASSRLTALEIRLKNRQAPPKRETKKAKGGCV